MRKLCCSFFLLMLIGGDSVNHASNRHAPYIMDLSDSYSPTSLLLSCSKDDADVTLLVTVTALPDWPGTTFDFPLRQPTREKSGWHCHSHVCSIGPNGFYGAVNVGDTLGESIPIDVHLTYDRAPRPEGKSLEKVVDAPLYKDGDISFDHNWHVKWHWELKKHGQ